MKNAALLLMLFLMTMVSVLKCEAADVTDKTHGKPAQELMQAYFAMGCFWKSQYVFDKVPGVIKTTVGYCGGKSANPTYEQVSTHTTGHAETVKVEYDPSKVTYRKLLEVFFSKHDPTTLDRQGPDVGNNYRSEIFYTTPKQKEEALAYKRELEQSHRFSAPIVTVIEPVGHFYNAEDYHQKYFQRTGNVCF
jgi:peptide-methionine (S)-S-oxide reductase